jgi:hypothetical protein
MLGKKSSLGKMSSVSVMRIKIVVAQSAPKKPHRLSLVQDHKRRHSGGLLSRLMVHAARRDAEDLEGSAKL